QGNPYLLQVHEWYPFEKTLTALKYKSFQEHERTFDNLSSWFKDWLPSRFFARRAKKLGLLDTKVMAEGVIFYNFKRKEEGKVWRAKLRRDMFEWYYSDLVEVLDYDKAGRDE
ncbi:hypothetical protein KAI87_07775, partial [Myxococcota bacterium]|nr:hypothetical protein [Myxococcota bacterium]